MRSSISIRHGLTAVSMITLLAVAGCGGSENNKTCREACTNLFACATKLSFDPGTILGPNYATADACASRCTALDCVQKQQLINCVASMQCTSTEQAQAEAVSCSARSGCSY